jgi:hypothetical protein
MRQDPKGNRRYAWRKPISDQPVGTGFATDPGHSGQAGGVFEEGEMKHPFQPIEQDENGVYRFKKNRIVEFLLDAGQFDLNHLATMNFSNEDRTQFAQLIGYSVSGFGELDSYVSNDDYMVADGIANGEGDPRDIEIAILRKEIKELRESFVDPVSRMFGYHPDDLRERL